MFFRRVAGEGLACEIGQGVIAFAVAGGRRRQEPMALDDAAQIFIGDWNGMAESVEKNRIGCLGTNAGKSQKTASQSISGCGGKSIERTGELGVEQSDKSFERGSFARGKAGGLDEALEFFEGERAQAVNSKRSRLAQIVERALDGLPGGILREICAEDDLKGRLCGPPVLRAIGMGEPLVHFAQALGGSGFGRGHGCLQNKGRTRILLQTIAGLEFIKRTSNDDENPMSGSNLEATLRLELTDRLPALIVSDAIAELPDDKAGKPIRVEEQIRLAASIFSHSREGIMITAGDGAILDVNAAFTRITGYEREEVLGRNPRLLKSGRQSAEFYSEMWRALTETGSWSGELWNRNKAGRNFAQLLTISAVRNAEGGVHHYVAQFSDITAIKEQENRLEEITHFDMLTGLPNRVLLSDRMHQAMAQAHRRKQLMGVAYLDIDGFKAVNDLHGHHVGDELLKLLANRMKQSLREGDTLARLGGDEFVALLHDLANIEDAFPALDRLLAAATEPARIGEVSLQATVSIGIAYYPNADGMESDQLLRQADQAMYQAKLAGGNRYHIFDSFEDRTVRGHHEDLDRIRQALVAREFVLYYQPRVKMNTGEVVGAEALIRWQHPERGLLPPDAFLPVIEDHALAIDVGEWVIDSVLSQMEKWRAAGLDLPVSINVGSRQLQQTIFVERLAALLSAHPHVKPSSVELEILETSALRDIAQISQMMSGCREIGVSFSLDDFGTGYSSLAYLKKLPANILKIDQSFVRDILDDPEDLTILEGVLGLAAAFRREVIAEGVETAEHGTMLLWMGCEMAQGYFIARPMPPEKMQDWIATWRPDPRWVEAFPVNKENRPLLYAYVEHRTWIAAIEAFLKEERYLPPRMEEDKCRFSEWLAARRNSLQSERPAFRALDQLHSQLHKMAAGILKLKAQGRNSEGLARICELHGLRDLLLEGLREF